jgi:hypothetical protein
MAAYVKVLNTSSSSTDYDLHTFWALSQLIAQHGFTAHNRRAKSMQIHAYIGEFYGIFKYFGQTAETHSWCACYSCQQRKAVSLRSFVIRACLSQHKISTRRACSKRSCYCMYNENICISLCTMYRSLHCAKHCMSLLLLSVLSCFIHHF